MKCDFGSFQFSSNHVTGKWTFKGQLWCPQAGLATCGNTCAPVSGGGTATQQINHCYREVSSPCAVQWVSYLQNRPADTHWWQHVCHAHWSPAPLLMETLYCILFKKTANTKIEYFMLSLEILFKSFIIVWTSEIYKTWFKRKISYHDLIQKLIVKLTKSEKKNSNKVWLKKVFFPMNLFTAEL